MLAIRDSAAAAYNRPIAAQSVATAVRSFRDEVNRPDKNNTLFMHPDDFELWHLGHFDEESGAFIVIDPVCVCRAKDVKEDVPVSGS